MDENEILMKTVDKVGVVTKNIDKLELRQEILDLQMKLRIEHELRLDVESKLKDAYIKLGKEKGASETYKEAFKWILELFRSKYDED